MEESILYVGIRSVWYGIIMFVISMNNNIFCFWKLSLDNVYVVNVLNVIENSVMKLVKIIEFLNCVFIGIWLNNCI